MPSFGRWQTAGSEHPCDECPYPIKEGQVYIRLGFVDLDAWRNITRGGKDPNVDPVVMKRLFDVAIRHEYPVLKIHSRCWRGGVDSSSGSLTRPLAVQYSRGTTR